jgi:undecaprenyl-diphosphatase
MHIILFDLLIIGDSITNSFETRPKIGGFINLDFLEILKAIVIGIIQGVTEWLPISSTGHMILANEFMRLKVSKDFENMFFVIIQLGSILAILAIYFKKLNPFMAKNNSEKKGIFSLWAKICAASIPSAIVGFLLDDVVNNWFYNPLTIATTLILYGIAFILIENRARAHMIANFDQLDYKTALLIGAFQVLALIPGTSRSGATILGAIMLGSSKYVATEFSFFLAIPVMLGASALKILKFYLNHGFSFTLTEWNILLWGIALAFIVSIFSIKFLIKYIKKHSLQLFGYYRIALGMLIVIYFVLMAKN